MHNALTPPYKYELDTMLSPALAIVAIAMNCAACPLAVARAAAPPSSAAIRFSNTSYASRECTREENTHRLLTTVGLPMRE